MKLYIYLLNLPGNIWEDLCTNGRGVLLGVLEGEILGEVRGTLTHIEQPHRLLHNGYTLNNNTESPS